MSLRQIELARSLPPKLIRFFERYPPKHYAKSAAATSISSAPEHSQSDSTTTTVEAPPEAHIEVSTDAIASVPTTQPVYLSPFSQQKDSTTGRWHNPKYSLRRQADLVKLAKKYGVEELLPFSKKGAEERLAHRIEHGLRVKGTGVGQKVKGHWYERTLSVRLEKRRQAMLNMPRLIYQWKQVRTISTNPEAYADVCQLGHGRGWKKYPGR